MIVEIVVTVLRFPMTVLVWVYVCLFGTLTVAIGWTILVFVMYEVLWWVVGTVVSFVVQWGLLMMHWQIVLASFLSMASTLRSLAFRELVALASSVEVFDDAFALARLSSGVSSGERFFADPDEDFAGVGETLPVDTVVLADVGQTVVVKGAVT